MPSIDGNKEINHAHLALQARGYKLWQKDEADEVPPVGEAEDQAEMEYR